MKVQTMIFISFILIHLSYANELSNQKARDFTLRDLNGKQFTLSKNIGKGPIIINFWATWCLPCYSEMSKLNEIYKKYAAHNLQILSIAIDDAKTASKVRMVVRSKKYPFTILLDANQDVYKKYQLTGVPYLFLLDKNGAIIYSHKGFTEGDEHKLENYIKDMVRLE